MDKLDLLVKAIEETRNDQKEITKRIEHLHQYIIDHMENEENQITDLRVSIARIEENLKTHNRRWGALATVITATIVSALGTAAASFF